MTPVTLMTGLNGERYPNEGKGCFSIYEPENIRDAAIDVACPEGCALSLHWQLQMSHTEGLDKKPLNSDGARKGQ